MLGKEIVTPEEMVRLEELASTHGYTSSDLMEQAAYGLARVIEQWIKESHLPRRVLLMTGRGNNGGDAFAAGTILLNRGFFVKALHIPGPSSQLCSTRLNDFVAKGGRLQLFPHLDSSGCSVIVDGLVGIGFKGTAEGVLKEMINWAQNSLLPILSIDLPSGLNATTGKVPSVAIRATATIYCGFPKTGFFIEQGWDHVGILIGVDMKGFATISSENIRASATLLDPRFLSLPLMQRSRHKYEAGYLLGLAGSNSMTGSAALSVEGAFRSGAGIVSLFCSASIPLLSVEAIRRRWSWSCFRREVKRATAYFVGPGIGKSLFVRRRLRKIAALTSLPCVVDADALAIYAQKGAFPENAVLTPHRGEAEQLFGHSPSILRCHSYAETHKVTLVLKGAPTFIFHRDHKPLVIGYGDPGMATAGSGDLLTGIIGGLLAQRLSPYDAAALAVFIHGYAGELAARELTSYSLMASDIARFVPQAFRYLIDQQLKAHD